MISNMTGLSIEDKIDRIIKYLNTMEMQETGLPNGTVILRRNREKNGGMNYGVWEEIDEGINTKNGIFFAYIRTE